MPIFFFIEEGKLLMIMAHSVDAKGLSDMRVKIGPNILTED